MMLWVSIINRFNIPKKILTLIDELINVQVEENEKAENNKKNGLFY